ncbi:MAG: cold-shock protein [bacterium]
MATGKINFIDHSKGYGWISPDDKDGPERIKLKQHMLLGEEQFAEFEIGMPVEFELNEEGRARWVRAADAGTS